MSPPWSPELVEVLRDLRAQRMRPIDMAKILPFSVGAIKGKLWRLHYSVGANARLKWTTAQKDEAVRLRNAGTTHARIAELICQMDGANPTIASVRELFRRKGMAGLVRDNGGARKGAGAKSKFFPPARAALIKAEYATCARVEDLVARLNTMPGPVVAREQVMNHASKHGYLRDKAILRREQQERCRAMVMARVTSRPLAATPIPIRLVKPPPVYPSTDDIKAWIAANGVTKLPTVAILPTQATIPEVDLTAIRARIDPDPVYSAARRRMKHKAKRA